VGNLPLAVRQLVAISRAIATQAKLVIMDEPTTSLTRREVDNLIRVVADLQRDKVAVLFVTHKLDECYSIGGQAIVFRDGLCVAQGPIENYSKAQLGHLMTGRDIDASRYRRASASGEILLQLQGLCCRSYFRDVSFSVRKGEILGITGLMDSGRNELAKTIAGVMASSAGTLSLCGQPLRLTCPADSIRNGIGYVPEDRLGEGLFLDKPILSNMVAAILDKLRTTFGTLDHSRARAVAQELVEELHIATPNVDLPVQSLSGGNQQRVLIARWLTIKPQLLVLHGPTVGVDVGSKDTIYRAIQALAERGLGVILISDDLPELLQNADRILVMRDGRVQQEFSADVAQEEDLYRAMLGTEKGPRSV
jgi:simple sugar transport system ATP-binding protein